MREPWEQEKWEREHWDKDQWKRNLQDDIRRASYSRPSLRKSRGCGRSGSNGLLVGAVIVAVGTILLLDNMGIVRAHDFWHFWPVLLIVLGVSRILESRGPAAVTWGGLIAGVGTLFLLDNLGLHLFRFSMLWPLIIIGFGVTRLLRSAERSRILDPSAAMPPMAAPAEHSDSDAHFWAFFGGGRRRIDSLDFRTAEVFAVFGGFHIDMRGAQIPAGRAVIDINAIFGGVEVRVPDTWRVLVRGQGIFGAFEDKTLPPRTTEGLKPPELIVTGSSIFGGATIRN